MKYGVLLNFRTENIGDDIQSYAACRFLPSVDYIIDRESLDTFGFGRDQETVSVIMNGWFMYNKFNWPPAPSINPLLLSMHFSKRDYYGVGDRFLDSIGGDYLRHYGPVGARDHATKELLNSKGIDTYYSGCLTLTLNMQESEQHSGEVILVDLDKEDQNELKDLYPTVDFAEVTHYVDPNEYQKIPGRKRLENVENLLRRYRKAKCVVTSRMHCALPCLALGTPVLLVYKQENINRFQAFFSLLKIAESGHLGEVKSIFDINNPPQNSSKYLEIRNDLEKRCFAFVEKAEIEEILPRFSVPLDELHNWQKQLLHGADLPIRNTVTELTKWIGELEEAKEWNAEQLALANKKLDELRRLKKLTGLGENGVITRLRNLLKNDQ